MSCPKDEGNSTFILSDSSGVTGMLFVRDELRSCFRLACISLNGKSSPSSNWYRKDLYSFHSARGLSSPEPSFSESCEDKWIFPFGLLAIVYSHPDWYQSVSEYVESNFSDHGGCEGVSTFILIGFLQLTDFEVPYLCSANLESFAWS